MKIASIEKNKEGYNVYTVTFKPNIIERLLGLKEKVELFKDSGRVYSFGEGTVYLRKDGSKLPNGNAIAKKLDNFQNAW